MLIDNLRSHATAIPYKPAIISGNHTLSYEALWDCIVQRGEQLIAEGVRAHQPYVFLASQDADFIITYCALHYLGAVAVPLEATTPETRQLQIKQELRSADILAEVHDILFTTGTTGLAKGVMLTDKAWNANAENLIEAQGFSSELLFIIVGPLNHLGSLSKIYPTLYMGGTLCILPRLSNMDLFFDALDLPFTKMASFLVPASIRMLLSLDAERLASYQNKIDFIETGAAPMAVIDMEWLCRTLPHSRLFNTYASTETGIVCTYNFQREGCVAGCLGRPMKHSRLSFSPAGNILCSGDTVMSGYVGAPELTAQVLKNGIVHTQDLGNLDEEGRLHLEARLGDIINVGGYKVAPTDVENVALQLPYVRDCICIAGSHPILGTVLKLLVILTEGKQLNKHRMALYLKKHLEIYMVPSQYEAVTYIERTYNGKLNRAFYRSKYWQGAFT